MSKFYNKSASALLKNGSGKLRGVFVSTASASPTIQFVDGITDNDDVIDKATGVLTSSGAMVPGAHATSEVVSDATAPANTATLTIDTTVYTFKTTLAAAYDVLIGASAATALDNLKSAVNATAGEGTTYGTGTVAHPTVIASTNTDTVQTFFARVIGTTANAYATTETSANLAFADSTLGGGTGNSNPGVATTAATVTINGRVYTVVNELTETSGQTAVVDQILYGGSEAVMLDNLKVAITAGATAGTNYSTGTVVNADVTATTNTDTAQTIEALVGGLVGNAITTTETMANTAWGAVTLTGGLEVNLMLIEAFVGVAGTMYTFPEPAFNTGLQLRISGTAEVTVFVD